MLVVRVRPFRPPHHEADVFVTVVGRDDAAALVRWFSDQGIEHELLPSDEDGDGVLARPVGHLTMEVPDLQDHQEPVLHSALQGGQRLLRHDRLVRARNLPPPAAPGPNTNNTTASLPASSGPRPPSASTHTTTAGGRPGLSSSDAPPSDSSVTADTTNRVSASPFALEPIDLLGESFPPFPPRHSSSIRSPPDPLLGRQKVDAINSSFASDTVHSAAAKKPAGASDASLPSPPSSTSSFPGFDISLALPNTGLGPAQGYPLQGAEAHPDATPRVRFV